MQLNNNNTTRDKQGDSIYTKNLSHDSLPSKGCYTRCKNLDMEESLSKEGKNVSHVSMNT